MNIISARSALVPGLAMLATATLLGCGSSSTPATGTGGVKGTGGATVTGTGGSTGTGTGGSTVSGTGGGPPPLLNYTFDTTTQNFVLSVYPDANSVNLAATYPADGGTDAAAVDGGSVATKPTLAWDGTVGNPTLGSLQVSVTFTDYNQYVDPTVNLPAPLDLTHKMVHARLARSLGEFSGGAQLHVSTGASFGSYQKGDFAIAPTIGAFGSAMIDMDTAPSVSGPADPAMVVQVGVQIYSGAPVGTAPYLNAGVPVVFNIDTITD